MDFIKVYIDEDNYIIDTPGLINYRSFGAYLDYESVKVLTPKSFLRVRTYQLNSGQTLYLGGLVRVDIECDTHANVSCFVSNNLYIHRTKTEKADEIRETQKYKMLVPPLTEDEYARIGEFKTHEIVADSDEFYDLIIPGVGFLHMSGDNLRIKLTLSEKVKYEFIKSFI